MSKSPFYKTGISKSPLFEAGEYADTKRKQAVRKGQKRLTGEAAELEAIGPLQMNEGNISKSPLHAHHEPAKPSHGETYGDFHKRTSGGATDHWGGPETDKKLLNSQYSDSSSTFVRNPKHLDLNPAKLKEARNKGNNKKLNLPKPKPNENQSDYLARTIGNPGFIRSDKILNKQ